MKTCSLFKYNLLMTFLMCVSTIIKLYFLYTYVMPHSNAILAYARTAALLLFFYILLNYILFCKAFIPRLIVHEILGLIILADIIYFSYFNSLPTLADLQKINLLFAIRSSVAALFKLRYLLFFVDVLIIIAFHASMKHKPSLSLSSRKVPISIAALLAMFLLIDTFTFKEVDSDQDYNGFSLIKSLESVKESGAINPKYFGIAKNTNVIVIQVEALQNFVINSFYNSQELTPNLNKLINQNSLYFDRYYQYIASGGTSDAEFASQLSLYPSSPGSAYSIYVDRYLYGLPQILKDNGYSTMAIHGFKPEFWNRSVMYPILGFERFISGNDFEQDDVIGMGVSDMSFFRQSVQYLKNAKQPFYTFLVTLSSHHPYIIPEKYKNIKLERELQNTLLGGYLEAINYTDYALGSFLEDLKKQGLYDNSIIAVYGDHNAISISDKENYELMAKLLGHHYGIDEAVNVPLIIHIPGMKECKVISTAGGQMDFMPTMLNLLGIDKGDIKFYGQDLCNTEEGFAAMQRVMPKGSFIDNEKVYLASADGIFEHGEAWDYKSRNPIDLELCRSGFNRAVSEIDECKYLLAKDLLRPKFQNNFK